MKYSNGVVSGVCGESPRLQQLSEGYHAGVHHPPVPAAIPRTWQRDFLMFLSVSGAGSLQYYKVQNVTSYTCGLWTQIRVSSILSELCRQCIATYLEDFVRSAPNTAERVSRAHKATAAAAGVQRNGVHGIMISLYAVQRGYAMSVQNLARPIVNK